MTDWTARARALDAADPLAGFRERFFVPAGTIYLDGNSLGLLSRDAEASLLGALSDWKRLAIGGWTEADPPWIHLAETLGARVAALIGAEPEEVVAAGGTTVNLHQLLATLYPGTGKILLDALAFPSDRYAVQSHLRLRGRDPATHLAVAPSRDGYTLDDDALDNALSRDIAVAVLPSVLYTSGQLLNMARWTKIARQRGIVLLWDLSHSVGIVPHRLAQIGADGAFWCHYKWLNAGPGAVGGLYLNRRHHDRPPGLAGWFGASKATLFDRNAEMTPAPGAAALQIGTTHVLSLAPLSGALALHEEAGNDRLREKSLAMTALLRERIASERTLSALRLVTPHEDDRRGGHLALVHPQAGALSRALRRNGIIPDHRPPDLLRLAPSPLYNTYSELVATATALIEILAAGGAHETADEAGIVP